MTWLAVRSHEWNEISHRLSPAVCRRGDVGCREGICRKPRDRRTWKRKAHPKAKARRSIERPPASPPLGGSASPRGSLHEPDRLRRGIRRKMFKILARGNVEQFRCHLISEPHAPFAASTATNNSLMTASASLMTGGSLERRGHACKDKRISSR